MFSRNNKSVVCHGMLAHDERGRGRERQTDIWSKITRNESRARARDEEDCNCGLRGINWWDIGLSRTHMCLRSECHDTEHRLDCWLANETRRHSIRHSESQLAACRTHNCCFRPASLATDNNRLDTPKTQTLIAHKSERENLISARDAKIKKNLWLAHMCVRNYSTSKKIPRSLSLSLFLHSFSRSAIFSSSIIPLRRCCCCSHSRGVVVAFVVVRGQQSSFTSAAD